MEIFTLSNPVSNEGVPAFSSYKNGEIINGIDSLLWVERYLPGGEFTIIGDPTPELLEKLSVDTLISHSDTYDIMMVENHEIDESKDGDTKVKITGRSIATIIMENRIVTANLLWGFEDPAGEVNRDYRMLANYPWAHAHKIIVDFVENGFDYERLSNFQVNYDFALDEEFDSTFIPTERTVKFGTVYDAVVEILASFDLGLKVERPHHASTRMEWYVHRGQDRRATVQFNWLNGDLDKARYLWTNKNLKNQAYVKAQFYGTVIEPHNNFGWEVRAIPIDMSDLKDFVGYDGEPYAIIHNLMEARALDALGARTRLAILDATISRNANLAYRKDYNLGDIVYVIGNYGISVPMRVTEYAETLDETGEWGFPTLSAV